MPALRMILLILPMVSIGVLAESAFSQLPKELDVYWRVDILRHDNVLSTYEGAGFCPVAELPAQCQNNIDLPRKEAKLFERLCGSSLVTVTIEPQDGGVNSFTCQGNGPWAVVVTAKLQDAHGNPQGEDFPVDFTMELTPSSTHP